MTNENGRSRTLGAILAVALALGIALADQHACLAGKCGEYCEAKRVRTVCEETVQKKGLQGQRRDVGFRKCRAHLMNSENPNEKVRDVKSGLD